LNLKGMTIWILGFFSLIAGANVVNATWMWFEKGPAAMVTPYLFGSSAGFPVYIYMILSVVATLLLLAATSHMVVSELSVADQIRTINEKVNRLQAGQESQQKVLEGVQARIFLVDESLERTRKEFSKGLVDQGDVIRQNLETTQQSQQKMMDAVQGRVFLLDESMKGVKKGLNEQGDLVKAVNANLVDKVTPQLAGVKDTIAEIEQRDKKTVSAITKQKEELEGINSKLERLESALFKPKPLLTSLTDVEAVKGIGPGKGAELREIGVKSVGDLIMADTKAVAEKTGSSENTVEKWQGRAQLSMAPGLKDKDLVLLEDLDIIDRKSLAAQDPIELSKKMNAIFKVNLAKGKVSEADMPTIEEIDSWVKFARS